MKKNFLILLIPLFFFSCIEVEKEFEVEKIKIDVLKSNLIAKLN